MNQQANNGHEDKEPIKAVVLYDFNPETERELTLKKGEVIEILRYSEKEGWWFGKKSTNQKGYFPGKFVSLLEAPTSQVKLSRSGNKLHQILPSVIGNVKVEETTRGREFFNACHRSDVVTVEKFLPRLAPTELNNRYYLEASKIPTLENRDHFTPLDIACAIGSQTVVEALLSSPFVLPNIASLYYATYSGNIHLCLFLKPKCLQMIPQYTNFNDWVFKTPILKSIKSGNLQMCKFICNLLPAIPEDLPFSLLAEVTENTDSQMKEFLKSLKVISRNHNTPRQNDSLPAVTNNTSSKIPFSPKSKSDEVISTQTKQIIHNNQNNHSHNNLSHNHHHHNHHPQINNSNNNNNNTHHHHHNNMNNSNGSSQKPQVGSNNHGAQNRLSINNNNIKMDRSLDKAVVFSILLELNLFSYDKLNAFFGSQTITPQLISNFLHTFFDQLGYRSTDDGGDLRTFFISFIIGYISDYNNLHVDRRSFLILKSQYHTSLQEKYRGESDRRSRKIQQKESQKTEINNFMKIIKTQHNFEKNFDSSLLSHPSNEQLEEFFPILPPKDLANSTTIHQMLIKLRGITFKQEQQITLLHLYPYLDKSFRKNAKKTSVLLRSHLLQSFIDYQHLYLLDYESHPSVSLFYSSLAKKLGSYFMSLKVLGNVGGSKRDHLHIELNSLIDLMNNFLSMNTPDSRNNRDVLPWGTPFNSVGPLVFVAPPVITDEYSKFLRNNGRALSDLESISHSSYPYKLELLAEQLSKLITFRYIHCLMLIPFENIMKFVSDAYFNIVHYLCRGGKNVLEALYDPAFLVEYCRNPHQSDQVRYYLRPRDSNDHPFSEIWSTSTGIVDITYSPPKFFVKEGVHKTNVSLGWRIGFEYEANYLQMQCTSSLPRDADRQFFLSLQFLSHQFQEKSLNKFASLSST